MPTDTEALLVSGRLLSSPPVSGTGVQPREAKGLLPAETPKQKPKGEKKIRKKKRKTQKKQVIPRVRLFMQSVMQVI